MTTQNLKDLEAKYKVLGDEIEKLKKQEEVVYKIGDVFNISGEGLYMLVQVNWQEFVMINLKTGGRYTEPLEPVVGSSYSLTKEFVSRLCYGFQFRKVNVNFVQV